MAKQIAASPEGAQLGTNQTAIWRFLIDHEQVMRQRCRQIMRSPQDAEDAFGDLRLRLFNLLQSEPGRLASIHNANAWLRRVANNHCIDHIRRTPLNCDLDQVDLALQHNTCWQPPTHCPEQQACLQEELSALGTALRSLPRQLGDLLEQRCIDGAEYGELAILFELSEPNIRKRVQLARQQLRNRMEQFSSEGARR